MWSGASPRPRCEGEEDPLSDTTPQPRHPSIELVERAVASVLDASDLDQIAAAVRLVSTEMVIDVLHGGGDAGQGELVATGLGASAGVAEGTVRTSVGSALDAFDQGDDVVLVLPETTPADEIALRVAVAVVTVGGGLASHAAVVARDLALPAVVGTGPHPLVDGDRVWVDGSTGEVRRPGVGSVSSSATLDELPDDLATLLGWADRLATIKVMANADHRDAAALARRFGATGIGLCRIEHMFLGARAALVAAVLAGGSGSSGGAGGAGGRAIIDIEEIIATDLVDVFGEMSGLPVTVRLLDAPRHEFGGPGEHNPMMGLRGVRLALINEPLVRAQAAAIATAVRASRSRGDDPRPKIMVPLVALPGELTLVARWIRDEVGPEVPIGAMIETPRAALCADRLAATAEFVSFGTNDLTQFTYGWSRDDLESQILDRYLEAGILDASPFETLDEGGVVRLLALAIETARSARAGIATSICGEHGGDPRSVAIAARLGIDAVSTSPHRVPVARLAAAHAAVGPGPGPHDIGPG